MYQFVERVAGVALTGRLVERQGVRYAWLRAEQDRPPAHRCRCTNPVYPGRKPADAPDRAHREPAKVDLR